MIVVGTLMAVAAGAAVPIHVLMAGNISDLFVAHSISLDLREADTNATSGTTTDYFCSMTERMGKNELNND